MPGGLLNLIAVGQANIILNGNPKKTFWRTSYSKYTNFGMQKFRIDFNGSRKLRMSDESRFTFKIPRYGDLVMDSYLAVTLPHIWSPLFPVEDNIHTTTCGDSEFNRETFKPSDDHTAAAFKDGVSLKYNNTYYIPYNFKWIENLGLAMIKEIEVTVGGQTLQKYSGEYLISMIQRDFPQEKKNLIDKMTGNTTYFNDPQYDSSNILQKYPNAVYNSSSGGAEPSIRGRQLLIPLNLWFGLTSKQAFPLVSLQYNELEVNVTMRPVRELFLIRDVLNPYNNYAYKAPNFNEISDQMYYFLQTPPGVKRRVMLKSYLGAKKIIDTHNSNQPTSQTTMTILNELLHHEELGPSETTDDFYNSYTDKRNDWDTDIHLISTYAFLSDDERRVFASQPQEYIIKEVYETDYHDIVNSTKLKLDSFGMVASWMWFARRSDAVLRNQWANFTNWQYKKNPNTVRIPTNNYTAQQPWQGTCTACGNTASEGVSAGCFPGRGCYWCQVHELDHCADAFQQPEPDTSDVVTKEDFINKLPGYGPLRNSTGRFQPYNNQNVQLPIKNPYSDSNFNKWIRAREYNLYPGDAYMGDYIMKNETILDQKGYYPPTVDIICDTYKGLYVGADGINSINGQGVAPVWEEQGSVNTNYPIWCPTNVSEEQAAPGNFPLNGIGSSSSGIGGLGYTNYHDVDSSGNTTVRSRAIANFEGDSIEVMVPDDPSATNPEFKPNIKYIGEPKVAFPCSESLPAALFNDWIDLQSYLNTRTDYNDDEVEKYLGYLATKAQYESVDPDSTSTSNAAKHTPNGSGSEASDYEIKRQSITGMHGEYWGSPYHRTLYPLAWGSSNVLPSPFSTSGVFLAENKYDIISTVGILLDGKYRENIMERTVYEYIEKYTRSSGGSAEYELDGLMCYNFCLHTDPFDLQPSGAMNMSRFSTIELELTTIEPPLDQYAQFANICKEEMQPDGSIKSINIGVNKPSWGIYSYTYDVHVMEERYNIVKFTGGNVGLMFAR